jgi:hypothetical protein
VIEGVFEPSFEYMCHFNNIRTSAAQFYSNALSCAAVPLDGEVTLELSYLGNDARYFVATLIAISLPVITQSKP